MNLKGFLFALVIVSAVIGLSGCEWSGSGQGNNHFSGVQPK